jgi:sugar-specific transcriptional regulator TrmB
MTNDNIASMLSEFGLTRLESTVYLALLSGGELNGYEAAKNLGMSRSNAYTTLASLADKGAAWIIEGSPVRYTAVPADEFCANRLRRLGEARERIIAALPVRRDSHGMYATIRGKESIVDKLRHLVDDARERVYLALHGSVLTLILPEVGSAARSGKKIVIITDPATARDLRGTPGCERFVVHAGSVEPGDVRAIADSLYILTGDLSVGDGASALFSDQENLVKLFKTSLSNEIKLIEMGELPNE